MHTGLEQHGLELFAGLVAFRQGIDGQRSDGIECGVEDGALGQGDLGLPVVLINGAGDLDRLPNFWVEAGATGVDEDGLRSLGRRSLTRARGLDSETVEGLLTLPHGGDNTLGGDVLALERGLRAGALDLRDGGGGTRLGRLRVLRRGCAAARVRCWRSRREVGGVVVGVGAGVITLRRGGVAQGRGRGALAKRRLPVPHEVYLGPGGVVKLDRALGTGHAETALSIRGGQRIAFAAATFLDEVVAASRDGTVKRGLSTGVALGGEVLHGPSGEVDGGTRWVVELDEVVGEGGVLVAAATIDLGDDGSGAVHRGAGLGDNDAGRH